MSFSSTAHFLRRNNPARTLVIVCQSLRSFGKSVGGLKEIQEEVEGGGELESGSRAKPLEDQEAFATPE